MREDAVEPTVGTVRPRFAVAAVILAAFLYAGPAQAHIPPLPDPTPWWTETYEYQGATSRACSPPQQSSTSYGAYLHQVECVSQFPYGRAECSRSRVHWHHDEDEIAPGPREATTTVECLVYVSGDPNGDLDPTCSRNVYTKQSEDENGPVVEHYDRGWLSPEYGSSDPFPFYENDCRPKLLTGFPPVKPTFGSSTEVEIGIEEFWIPGRKRLAMFVGNENDFAVRVRLAGRTTKRVAVSRKRKRKVSLPAKTFEVAAEGSKSVNLALPRPARRALAKKDRLNLRLTAKVTDPAGITRTVRVVNTARVTPGRR